MRETYGTKQKTGAGHYRTTLRIALDSDSYSGGEGGDQWSSEVLVGQVDFHAPVRRVRRALGVVGNSPRAGQADAVEARPVDAARNERVSNGLGPAQREGHSATFFAAEEFLTNSVRTLVVAAHAVETALRIRVPFQSHRIDVRVSPEHQSKLIDEL